MRKLWGVAPRHVLMASSMSGLTPAASTKNSSTELSEAINSLFRWYQDVATCYACLEDCDANGSVFASSRRFTRGWTLQELIAPSTVEFPASNSAEIGMRTSLQDEIVKIVSISPRILCKICRVDEASIAQRMS